jgi:single-stranded DNA-specific DHH superfamily exonuclease
MLTSKEVEFVREELETAKNPLFFHDGDGDGLGSFLILYRINREGKSYSLNTTSCLNIDFIRKVDELNPDKIFVLDIPLMTQEFVDKVKRPIFWIDHHPVQEIKKVHYYNPRKKDENAYIPTSRMAYQISQKPEDLWLATAGCLADFYMPDFIDEFIKKYPKWLEKKEDLPTMLFKRPVGKLAKLLFFLQKGPTSDVRKSIKILTRIKSPDEIFKQETSQGKFIYKRFIKINEKFEELLKEAKKEINRSKLILFFYPDNRWSFTANLANELSGLYQNKFVIIARRKDDLVKCSLRGKNVLTILKKALIGINGSGGGHPVSCGAVIDTVDWDKFIENLKKEMK